MGKGFEKGLWPGGFAARFGFVVQLGEVSRL